jgi:small ligand-binding sensory domain FIST
VESGKRAIDAVKVCRKFCPPTGPMPVAGFFCDGELGPVGGQNFLHTFTASIALFPDSTG